MKKILIGCVVILAGIGWYGCSDNTESARNNDKESTATTKIEKRDLDNDSREFALKAANGSMMEVELGKLAEKKSSNKKVKSFGAMMVRDHSEAGEKLKNFASAHDLNLPDSIDESSRKEVDKLSKKKGLDFDRAYMDMMVDDHNKDLEDFRKAADNLSDSSLKSFAQVTMIVLAKHLDSAKSITGQKM
jgi:putative membrane protein